MTNQVNISNCNNVYWIFHDKLLNQKLIVSPITHIYQLNNKRYRNDTYYFYEQLMQ